jgi:putative endonuclease
MQPSTYNKRLGDWGEERAAAYLEHLGYTILHRQWRLHHQGEIDLVALDPQQTLVFVEVKTRQAGQAGSAYESLTSKKASRMRNSIEAYLQQHPIDYPAVRVDWLILAPCDEGSVTVDHIQNVDLFGH